MKSAFVLPLLGLLGLALASCKGPGPAPSTPPVAAEPAPTARNAPPTAPASRFPVLKLQTVQGASYELAAHRGKWVVVNFWATWCAPCIKEMPELSELDQRRDDVEVIGLAYEEIEVQAMRDFLKQRPVAYPVAFVDVYAPPADFATPRGLPMTYLIAPDGAVARQFLGPVTARELESAIAAPGAGA